MPSHIAEFPPPTITLKFDPDYAPSDDVLVPIILLMCETEAFYYDMYLRFENKLWKRTPRLRARRKGKWLFECKLCSMELCSFESLTGHLNCHYRFTPHRCCGCDKSYASRTSLLRHSRITGHPVRTLPRKDLNRHRRIAANPT